MGYQRRLSGRVEISPRSNHATWLEGEGEGLGLGPRSSQAAWLGVRLLWA